jgi:hypothetical protein
MQGICNVANSFVEEGLSVRAITNIAKGIDSQYLYGKSLAGPVIKQVKLANGKISDFISKGWRHEHKFIDIKNYIEEGGKLIRDPKLADRIKRGLQHGISELEGLEGAFGKRLEEFMQKTGQSLEKLGQKVVFSIEADKEVIGQFREELKAYAGELAGEMGEAAKEISIEVLEYAPSAELKALLEGAGKGAAAVGLFLIIYRYKYATAEDRLDKIIAVADAAGNIMLLEPIPAIQVAGGVLVVGSMALSYVHDKEKEEQKK